MNRLKLLIESHSIPVHKCKNFLLEGIAEQKLEKGKGEKLPDTIKQLDFQQIFGNNNPVTIEIGCGRGELLVNLSLLNPEMNFLGVELSAKRIITMLKLFDSTENTNIKLIKAKVDTDFLRLFYPRSVARAIILHPDPWPKKRHHKNRLINPEFVDKLADIIIQGGEVLLSTDYEDYAMQMVECFSNSQKYRSAYTNGYSRESFWKDLETHFEKKMKREGFIPYYLREMVI